MSIYKNNNSNPFLELNVADNCNQFGEREKWTITKSTKWGAGHFTKPVF